MMNPYSLGKSYNSQPKEVKPSNNNHGNSNSYNQNNIYNNNSGFNTLLPPAGMKSNSRFVSNVNLKSTMNQQERVITFGQDSNENSFKRILRKPMISNLIQNTSYNIITGAPYNTGGGFTARNEKIDDLFYSFKNSGLIKGNIPENNLNNYSNINSKLKTLPQIQNTNSTSLTQRLGLNDNKITKATATADELIPNNTATNAYSTVYKDSTSNLTAEASSVKEYSVKTDQNIRCRNTMEDKFKIIDKFNRNSDSGYFAVFDGHGGVDVANYAAERLHLILEKELNSREDKPKLVESLLGASFTKLDEEVKFIDSENVGCTATVVYITKEVEGKYTKRVLYCANVGDSRCVLVSSLGAKRLSYDHKVSDQSEAARIINSGGVIFRGRVFGSLILSRALGDLALKPHGVIASPSVTKHFITERDRYLVIASDGVWDVLSDEELYRLQLTVSNSEEFVNVIVKTALQRGSEDNISCIVLKLFN